MTIILRVVLLIASIVTSLWIFRKIRRCKVRQEDAVFWICFAFALAALGIFPRISYFLLPILGIQAPVNLVYLVIIFLLIEKLLSVSSQVSMLENKIEVMAAELALRCKYLEEKTEENNKQVNV